MHVWWASLDQPAPLRDQLEALLCDDERERATRFVFERDRSRFIAGRGWLRVLLARYLALAPGELRFEYGAFGKPALAASGPWFNLSHSGALALYAVSGAGEVGVDVELEDGRDYAGEQIAERFFSPAEVASLRSLPASAQLRAFLVCWTRKEAFIKARGDGLSLALDSFDVSLHPDEEPALRRTSWSPEEHRGWRIADLSDQRRRAVAALAVWQGEQEPIEIRRLGTIESGMLTQEDR